MRAYGTVSPQFWIGETGRKIRGFKDAQIVAAYLITSPHANGLGMYYLPIFSLVNETGIEVDAAKAALALLSEHGFARYDHATEYVWVVEMARFQIGEQLKKTDKRVPGVNRELGTLTKCPFFADFCNRYRDAFHIETEAPCKGLVRVMQVSTPGTGTGTGTKQDQDQDQDQDHKDAADAAFVDAPPPPAENFEESTPQPELPPAPLNAPRKRPAPEAAPPATPPAAEIRAEDLPLPAALNTVEFVAAWRDWCKYRRKNRWPVRAEHMTAQLDRLASMGSQESVRAIRYSIAQQYQGLFQEKNDGRKSSGAYGAGRTKAARGSDF